MIEVFKEIKGFERRYEISNLGNIRNYKTKRLLSPRPNKDGYLRIGLRQLKSRKIYTYFIHRLVAFAFLENKDPKKSQINHIDNNRQNNRIDNLEWCTPSYNTKYSFLHKKSNKGEHNPRAILNKQQVKEIRELLKQNKSCTHISKIYNVSRSTIDAIKRNINWSDN